MPHGLFRWRITQSLTWHTKHAWTLCSEDGYVGSQSWFEFQIGIRSTDNNFISHNIIRRRCLLSDLLHRALKGFIGIGIHGKCDAFALLYTANISLIYISNHLHIGKVLRNGKQLGSTETGCNGLAFFNTFGKHNAVNRRCNGCITKIGLCSFYLFLRGIDLLSDRTYTLRCRLITQPCSLKIIRRH